MSGYSGSGSGLRKPAPIGTTGWAVATSCPGVYAMVSAGPGCCGSTGSSGSSALLAPGGQGCRCPGEADGYFWIGNPDGSDGLSMVTSGWEYAVAYAASLGKNYYGPVFFYSAPDPNPMSTAFARYGFNAAAPNPTMPRIGIPQFFSLAPGTFSGMSLTLVSSPGSLGDVPATLANAIQEDPWSTDPSDYSVDPNYTGNMLDPSSDCRGGYLSPNGHRVLIVTPPNSPPIHICSAQISKYIGPRTYDTGNGPFGTCPHVLARLEMYANQFNCNADKRFWILRINVLYVPQTSFMSRLVFKSANIDRNLSCYSSITLNLDTSGTIFPSDHGDFTNVPSSITVNLR